MDVPAMTQIEVRLRERHRSAALARRFTRETSTCRGHGRGQDATRVVSGLVSNVRPHARGRPVVGLRAGHDGVRVEVADDSPLPPTVRAGGLDGLGIRLVERKSTAWGVSTPRRGNVVRYEPPAVPQPLPA